MMSLLLAAIIQTVPLAITAWLLSSFIASTGIAKILSGATILGGLTILGMGTFWLAYATPLAIAPINWAVWVAVAFGTIVGLRQWRTLDPDLGIAFGLWAVTSILILLWSFGATGLENMPQVAATRWTHPLPSDNVIPYDFAFYLRSGEVPSPMHGDWLSSDRPPLQTGLYLALAFPFGAETHAVYQLVSTLLQMLVVPTTFLALLSLGVDRRSAAIGALIVGLSPLVLIHATFVWPKLLPAAMLLLAWALHFGPPYQAIRHDWRAGAVIGLLSVGAALSHGASIFTLIGFALAALATGRVSSLRYAAAALGTFVATYLTWVAYQTYLDPPGDRLIKWHLADVIPVEDTRSAWEATRDAYAGMPFQEFLDQIRVKFSNAAAGPFDFLTIGPQDAFRGAAFYHFMPAMGVIGLLSIIAVLVTIFSRRSPLAVAVVLPFAVWIVSIFSVSGVLVHQSSFFPIIASMILFVGLVGRWPVVAAAFVGAQFVFALALFPPLV